MTLFTGDEIVQRDAASSPHIKVRVLQQMAEALEDEAAGLYRRAAAYEEEEYLLNCEINGRQTEINRLLLKLEAMRSDRNGLVEKIEEIKTEAALLREEVFKSEEEIALAVIDDTRANEPLKACCESNMGFSGEDKALQNSLYFRRMTLADAH
ncbi:MAG TPA: hypothetical protein VF747_11215 [Blastocatellia bacterium]|jgi:chromosome segregation ATPase